MDEPTIERMRRYGASDEVLQAAREQMDEEQAEEACEVWDENWAVWQFFLAVGALWQRAGMDGRRCALDWPGVEVVARGLGVVGRRWRQWVVDLLLIQDTVLVVDAEKAARSEQ